MGVKLNTGDVFTTLFRKALEGDPEGGGLVSFNYFAGEPVTGLSEGRPMLIRQPNAIMNLANFMRVQLYASMETLKYGMAILAREHVAIDQVFGHGGLFKTEGVAQRILAAAIEAPVTVMQTASEGGAWGIALLASFLVNREPEETLEDFLTDHVFKGLKQSTVRPDSKDIEGFNAYMKSFELCIPAQKEAASRWRIS